MSRKILEPFVNVPTTHYDQLMGKVYNPQNVKLHPAPWPMQRTDFDIALNNKWEVWDHPKPTWMAFPSQGASMQPYNSNL